MKLQYVCLAGNHSVWAAQELLVTGVLGIPADDLKYRKSTVFKNSDLTEDQRLILAGNSIFHVISK